MTSPVNPFVVAELDQPKSPWAGIYLAEDIQLLQQAFESGSWIDGTIGGVGVAMDALGLMTDPLGTLVSWGVAWLIEHLKPLSDALDWLAGNPGRIGGYVATWQTLSGRLTALGGDYRDAVSRQLEGWTGPAAAAYRDHAGQHVAALDALGRAAQALSTITEGAAMLVALVRTMVRDLIADFVSVLAVRLWEWLAEEAASFGIATPWVIAQVTSLAGRWAAKIAHLLRALISSLRRLMPIIRRLEEIIQELKGVLRRLARDDRGSVPANFFMPWEWWGKRGGTRPSRAPDPSAVPSGSRTPAHPTKVKDRPLRRENESADVLAQNGFDVVQNPPPRPNGKQPDYLIEGDYFDCYSPDTPDLDNLRDGISAKLRDKQGNQQADRIVLNLDDSPHTLDDIKDVLTRKPLAGLKEILVVRGGQVIPFFPFS